MEIHQCHIDFANQLIRAYPKKGEEYAQNYLRVISQQKVPQPRNPGQKEALVRICQRCPQKYKGYSYALRTHGFTGLIDFMRSKGFQGQVETTK